MLAPDYYDKLPQITHLNQSNLSASARRDLVRLQGLHVPPSRLHFIPMCAYNSSGSTEVKCQSQPLPKPKLWGKRRNVKQIVRFANSDDASSSPSKLDCATLSSSKSAEEETIETKQELTFDNSGFIKPVLEDSRRTCKSWKTKDGVMVTKITGWEDSENPFEPITMMSRKITPDIQKRHPRHALRHHGMYFVRLANVVDPFKFYLEFITSPPKGSGSWDESLQKFYNQPGVSEKYKLRTLRPYPGQMYAIYNKDECKWERIRVHGFHLQKQTVAGMYLDRLQPFNDVPINSLFELHPNFGNWPRHPIKAGLTDIRPCGYIPDDVGNKTHIDWPQNAINFFKDYTKDKLFRAFIVSKATDRSDNIFHASDEDRYVQTSVYLFEVGAEYQIPVNAWLVQKGYAVPIKSMKDCLGMMETLHGLKLEIEIPSTVKEGAIIV